MRYGKQVVAIGLASMMAGCSGMKERRWDGCAIGGAFFGGVLGGTGAGVGLNNGNDDASDGEMAGAIAGGTVVGAVAGALLGHFLCDPPVEAPPPPPVAKPAPAPRKIETLSGPHFDFDQATIRPTGKAKLDHVVEVMQQNKSMTVQVNGYTDSVGSDAYNEKLSERRAEAAMHYLVDKGISPGRVTARGYGESNPISSNETAEGRAENRRVEVIGQ